MKRKVLFLVTGAILISLSLVSCSKEVEGCTDPNGPNYNPNATKSNGDCGYPAQDKKVVCFYFNDSDNNTCGTFGMPLLDQVEAANLTTYFITAHPNGTDTLFCPAAIDIATADSVSGFPDFGVGEQSNLLTQPAINSAITAEASETAQGGISVDYTVNTDSIIVTIYGKFYTNDASSYFATAYVVENDIVSPQIGASGSYHHKHVLRAASGASGMGDLVNTMPVSSATSFKFRRGVYRNPIWNISNVFVIAVLWRQNGSDFEYINAGG